MESLFVTRLSISDANTMIPSDWHALLPSCSSQPKLQIVHASSKCMPSDVQQRSKALCIVLQVDTGPHGWGQREAALDRTVISVAKVRLPHLCARILNIVHYMLAYIVWGTSLCQRSSDLLLCTCKIKKEQVQPPGTYIMYCKLVF